MKPLAFLEEVARLPAEQRKVLVPLIAWQLSVEQPSFPLEGHLLEVVTEFIKSLEPDEPGIADRVQARLNEAGVDQALLQELQTRAQLPPLSKTTFEPRQPPKDGQVPGGLLGQLALRKKP